MKKAITIKWICFACSLAIFAITIGRVLLYKNINIHNNAFLKIISLEIIEGSWALYHIGFSKFVSYSSLIIMFVLLFIYSYFCVRLLFNYKAVYVLIGIFVFDILLHIVSLKNIYSITVSNFLSYFIWIQLFGLIFDILFIGLLMLYSYIAKKENRSNKMYKCIEQS